MVWIHVDDGAVTGNNPTLLAEVEKELSRHIKIKWESELTSIVGMDIRCISPQHYVLSQSKLDEEILRDQEHPSSPLSVNTPLSTSTRLETETQFPPIDGGRFCIYDWFTELSCCCNLTGSILHREFPRAVCEDTSRTPLECTETPATFPTKDGDGWHRFTTTSGGVLITDGNICRHKLGGGICPVILRTLHTFVWGTNFLGG